MGARDEPLRFRVWGVGFRAYVGFVYLNYIKFWNMGCRVEGLQSR